MAEISRKKIWVVFPATEDSELVDVLYETTIHKLALVTSGMFARGAHREWDDAKVYDNEREARVDAESRLAKYRSYDRS